MRFQKFVALTLGVALTYSQLALAEDISPAKWKPADKRRVELLEMSPFPPQARVIEGQSVLISDTGSPIAVQAGLEALKQGGTAADAAATVALTQVTAVLGSYVSFAGIAQLVYYEAKTGKVYSMNAGWNSYRGEVDPKTIPAADLGMLGLGKSTGTGAEGRKTLVPGFMAGIEAMHRRFGRQPFAQLFQPAIWYAENGVTVTPLMAAYFGLQSKYLSRTAEGRNFLHQGGSDAPKVGDRFVQAELAKTLRGVATQGAKYMYTGPWGQQFVAAVKSNGGKVAMEDMEDYAPRWEEPLSTTFDGATVFVPGKGNEGGQQVLEALNLIEQLHVDRKDPYWKDTRVFTELSKILQFVEIGSYVTPEVAEYQRKNSLHFSPADRVIKAYAMAMAPLIGDMPAQTLPPPLSHHSAGTVVIDKWGNVAALVHTINSEPWGSTGIVVGGIPLSDAAGFQQTRLAAIKPGDRVPDDAAPTIVLVGKKPRLALATVGTSVLAETVRITLGILGNHLDPRTVIAAPALLYNYETPQPGETYIWKHQLIPGGAYDAAFLASLAASGVKVQQKTRVQVLTLRGTTALGMMDATSGTRRSVEDPSIIDFADANY